MTIKINHRLRTAGIWLRFVLGIVADIVSIVAFVLMVLALWSGSEAEGQLEGAGTRCKPLQNLAP